MRRSKQFFLQYFELIFWVAALVSLAFTDPAGSAHFSLCPLKALGIIWCPGCGLGHSISWLFHGNVHNSFQAHWLGVAALCIILYRIHTLAIQKFSRNKSFITH